MSINLIVDPYSMTGLIEKIGLNYEKPAFRSHQWIAKVFEVPRIQPKVILLGTSRAAHGLDPLDPAFAGKLTYNLAIDGAQISEIKDLFEHATNTSKIEIAIIGLDLVSFNNNIGDTKLRRDLMDVDNQKRSVSRLLETLKTSMSLEALFSSYQTIRAQNVPPEFTHNGQRTSKYYQNFIDEFGGTRAACEGYLNEISSNRKTINSPDNRVMSSHWNDIQAIIDQARKRNIELHFFISPTHAWDLEYLRAWGEWQRFLDWKRNLVRIIDDTSFHQKENTAYAKMTLWDFSGYNSVTTEEIPPPKAANPNMKYFWEFSHYRTRVGGWILERLLNNGNTKNGIPTDFGTILNRDNIETHIIHSDQAREEYIIRNSKDIILINDIVKLYKTQAIGRQ
ncbi:hypothetical protein [Methylomonas koyamae]|uniref:hypothetical protein n=1 Tax=Methylomonas koyamae TaxID=702114 RepID=UPI0028736B41|nr:hypothetical protein [Methylomonas koyamae]WNB74492.1 hypothetical protein RI210_14505 [Methylomonas koyamae]